MTKILKLVILVFVSSQAQIALAIGSCEQLWQMLPTLQERDRPIVDISSDFVAGISMKELTYTNEDLFRPGSELESNCYLDRVLDARTKDAIRSGALAVSHLIAAAHRRSVPPEAILQALTDEINAEFRKGRAEDDGNLFTLQAEIASIYKIQGISTGDPGRFQLFANTRGLYNQISIGDFVVLSYIRHLGIWNPEFDQVMDYLVAQNREFRPPVNFKVVGCDDPLEYRWGDKGRLLEESHNGLSSSSTVQYGLCRKKQAVWSYHYTLGWWELKDQALIEFCKYWWNDDLFLEACKQ